MIEPEQKNDQQQIESQDILAAVLSEDSAAEQVSSTPVEQDYSMEGLMYDLNDGGGNPWDTNDDLNDFNLDVTEADFDFFETSAPVVVAPEMTPNVLNIMSIDANSPPPPVIKEAPIDDVDMEEAMTAPKTNFTPNNDSLFTPFVISNNGTDDLSIETTSTIDPNSSNSTPMMHHKQEQKASTSAFQHELAYKSTTEQFVPRDFLPVSVGTHVNDAKYCSGGKFMYVPPHLKKNKGNDTIEKISPLLAKVLKKRDFNYSPDYIPNLMATSKRKVFAKPNPIKTIGFEKPVLVSKDIHMTDMYSVTKRKISVSDTDGSENSSSSSSSNSSTSSDDSDSGSSDDESIHQEHVVNKRLEALKQFQKSFVNSLLKATPAPLPRSETMDYDTPFASKLADGIMKPIKWRQSKAMEQSIDYLCQQAILGGYPFAGGLTEISQNGGEIGTEPAKVMAARRTNLMQVAHGAVTHVPSLQTDLNKLTMDFKAMLKQIFLYPEGADTATASDPISTPASEDLSMMTEPAAYMNSSLLGKIDVKGPLSIQKYYDLNGKRKGWGSRFAYDTK
jgi:hypothetical protein